MKIHDVKGGGGLRLHVREWGRPDGSPILFIHGWSQNHLCWKRQYESPLADDFRLVAFDLRGHGMSEAPVEPEHYAAGQLWADDLAAIIDQLGLDRPVLVGWSYAGFIICDYVRADGERKIGGINFVDAVVARGRATLGTLIGPGFLNHFPGAAADDLPTNIEAMRKFVRGCTVRPLPAEEFAEAVAWNVVVHPKVRAAMLAGEFEADDVLNSLNVPVLVSHGEDDTVILPAMAQHILAICPTAKVSWYLGIGHVPHMEDPERFNRELAEFVRHTSGARPGARPRFQPT